MINHNNGLLLCPMHDAFFDKNYISFNVSRNIVINNKIVHALYSCLNINKNLVIDKKFLNEERKKFGKSL